MCNADHIPKIARCIRIYKKRNVRMIAQAIVQVNIKESQRAVEPVPP